MVIEINKDIEKYQESIALGLTTRQFIYSALSLIVGAALILTLYPHVGITISSYIVIPVVAPIALSGFYTYNNMNFQEVMSRKVHMAFFNKTLLYVSTESQRNQVVTANQKNNIRGKYKRKQ